MKQLLQKRRREQRLWDMITAYSRTFKKWLEHRWLVYHGSFELIFESLGTKAHRCRLGIIQCVFVIHIENGILCVLIRIASMRRFK